MTDELPDSARRAFEAHDAYAPRDGAFELTTTRFEGIVTAEETDDWALRYTVEVRAPTLSAAVVGDVGPAVEEGWFETYERRLEDAPKATRESVELDAFDVAETDEEAVATFVFEFGNAERAADVAKAFVEYAEGTYMEGVVPGYEYRGVVADMLEQASQSGAESSRGGMPL
ncbi:MAG: DUF5813 family protein [Haloarculaceae archaeon]